MAAWPCDRRGARGCCTRACGDTVVVQRARLFLDCTRSAPGQHPVSTLASAHLCLPRWTCWAAFLLVACPQASGRRAARGDAHTRLGRGTGRSTSCSFPRTWFLLFHFDEKIRLMLPPSEHTTCPSPARTVHARERVSSETAAHGAAAAKKHDPDGSPLERDGAVPHGRAAMLQHLEPITTRTPA